MAYSCGPPASARLLREHAFAWTMTHCPTGDASPLFRNRPSALAAAMARRRSWRDGGLPDEKYTAGGARWYRIGIGAALYGRAAEPVTGWDPYLAGAGCRVRDDRR